MVVKVYGSKITTCTQRICTVLKEFDVKYEIVPVNIAAGENKTEEYIRTKHPFGQVPVLVRPLPNDLTLAVADHQLGG